MTAIEIGRTSAVGRGLPSGILARKLTLDELLVVNGRLPEAWGNWHYRPETAG